MQKSPIPEGARHLQDAEKNDAQPEKKEKELEQAKAEKKTASERKDRHVEGVSFDTTLSGRSPEMKEMKADELKTDIPSASSAKHERYTGSGD